MRTVFVVVLIALALLGIQTNSEGIDDDREGGVKKRTRPSVNSLIVTPQINETVSSEGINSIPSPSVLDVDKDEVSEQTRLDMIVRAFERLPTAELERFDIDISTPILEETLRAENLKVAWSQRQAELRIGMASIVKPAEFMAEIAVKLRDNKQNLSESIESLRELESFLDDIDNARDFHTIGGW
eukprot:CAMPEP_0119038928 /NCGR_PEP_ID=MMETSP1177-20130426/8136_1 /TAXON_ID=2985 /ORGANISM="Ochromonas sp, Strain CCMP1899" /LENGTH=184 /DNA_ID=CAMNT_0007002141 /DNA_START=109 /DNA_END=660 /DNA_ORIENTATION=-